MPPLTASIASTLQSGARSSRVLSNGIFLNEAGVPVTAPFAISDHSDGSPQAGWARVIYSAQEGKFLVSYTKILAPNVHGKAVRFVAYSARGPVMSGEIKIASGTGHPGTESGLAYSVPSRTFLVTWWTYYGPTVKPDHLRHGHQCHNWRHRGVRQFPA